MKSQIIPECEAQKVRLESLGYTEGVYHCPCGACDPEPAMVRRFEGWSLKDVEAWEDANVWPLPEFDG